MIAPMLPPDGWRLEAELYSPAFQRDQFAADEGIMSGLAVIH
jgi:hypothetical protein